jgi:hypothetical protein
LQHFSQAARVICVTVGENGIGDYGLFSILLVDMTDYFFTGIDVTAVDDHKVKAIVTLVSNDNRISCFGRVPNRKELYFEIHQASEVLGLAPLVSTAYVCVSHPFHKDCCFGINLACSFDRFSLGVFATAGPLGTRPANHIVALFLPPFDKQLATH